MRKEIDGYLIVGRVVPDPDTRVADFDCCSPEYVESYRRVEWECVGVILSVTYNGVLLSDHAGSLWGIESDDTEGIRLAFDDLTEDALEVGKAERAEMLAKLAD